MPTDTRAPVNSRLPVESLDHFTEQVGVNARGFPVYRVRMPFPPFANKGYMVERKGLYILEESPGMLVAVACMHFGEGQVRVMDARIQENMVIAAGARPLYTATTQTMCLWMLGAGFDQGLLVEALGTDRGQPVFMSLSWSTLPDKKDQN